MSKKIQTKIEKTFKITIEGEKKGVTYEIEAVEIDYELKGIAIIKNDENAGHSFFRYDTNIEFDSFADAISVANAMLNFFDDLKNGKDRQK